jgi:hydroxyethylthiazole kinase-like uncharacterized protein yjeF
MSGLPEKLYTADQVKKIDSCAIHKHGIPGYELMERAGKALFEAAQQRYPEASRWVIVCGAGNNAGDGYILARLAANAGKQVRLYALMSPDQLSGDALSAARDWLEADGGVLSWPPESDEESPGLLFDALLGTGLDRPVEGEYADAISWMNAQSCAGFAVDIPSGLNADTGQILGLAFQADHTVTFIAMKQGLFTSDGPDSSGEVIFDDLDVPSEVYQCIANSGFFIRENLLSKNLPERLRNAHKGDFGHVLISGGNKGMAGAVRLAGEAALRSGAGLVTVATHPDHSATLNLTRPELMVSGIKKEKQLKKLFQRADVLAVGPGLGTSQWSREVFSACLDSGLPMVIDADGLNLLAENPLVLSGAILTPHPAEAGRLLGMRTADIQSDRVLHARQLAEKYQSVVVLKGCGSVVAAPDGTYSICPLGNSGMATAGSGDVLTGIIAAFLGQGLEPVEAAATGVVAHAAAGDLAANMMGEYGLLAGDIIDALPGILD